MTENTLKATNASRLKSNKVLLIIIMVLTLLVIILFFVVIGLTPKQKEGESVNDDEVLNDTGIVENDAIKAGQSLSSGKCKGSGSVPLMNSPMDPEDFSILIPYGLMVGAHVTPIDHQYFSPVDYNSPRDSYEVRAIADGVITEITSRDRVNPNDPTDTFQEYRIIFTYTCTFLSYFDLVTSLTPELKAEYDRVKTSEGYASSIEYPVKAGEVIGMIGGQTLDFAVWDTEKPLDGFIEPSHYDSEAWKLYTANPYDYFVDEVRDFLIERNPRIIEPIEGKIDHDIDGKLVGNWFVQGTNGYEGLRDGGNYWDTHLSISPDLYDPERYVISMGKFNNEAKQFASMDPDLDPTVIGIDSGLVKVDLVAFTYEDPSGNDWRGTTLIKGPELVSHNYIYGCALFEMQEDRVLKFESFPEMECSSISIFSEDAKLYER